MLEQFVLFGGAKGSEIIFDLKKLDVLEMHDSFLHIFLTSFRRFGPLSKK